MGDKEREYRVFAGRPEGERPLLIPRYRGEDIIKMNLPEVR